MNDSLKQFTPVLSLSSIALAGLLLTACSKPPAPAAIVRPVFVTTVTSANSAQSRSFTSVVHARVETELGFRTGGKVVERPSVLACHRQDKRIVSLGPAIGEANLHLLFPEKTNVAARFRMPATAWQKRRAAAEGRIVPAWPRCDRPRRDQASKRMGGTGSVA